jgi:hypothetical protein
VTVDRSRRDAEKTGGHVLITACVLQRDVDCFALQLTKRRADLERQRVT